MDPVTQILKSSYDEFPYETFAHWKSTPDHLAVVAAHRGLLTPPVETSRILEIGCAAGSNLLPLVQSLPHAKFLGIDLSPRQIEAGQDIIRQLDLPNIELRCQNLMDFPGDAGEFDYIIAHGVYSWVPQPVRMRLLEICGRHLSPTGVAYISYNTYPGWRYRQVAREIMLFGVRNTRGQAQRVAHGREILSLISEHFLDQGPARESLRDCQKAIAGYAERYLAHDHIAEVNDPCYFADFVAEIRRNGLDYLDDAETEKNLWHRVPPATQELVLKLTSDRIEREQYLDLLWNQAFRSSVVCRADAAAKSRESLIQNLYVAANQPETAGGTNAQGKAIVQFGTSPFKINVVEPGAIAVLRHLRQAWPATVSFTQLVAVLSNNSPEFAQPAKAADALANLLPTYERLNIVELWTRPNHGIAPIPQTHPRVARYARWQAKHGLPVTTLRHHAIAFDAAFLQLIPLLDGTQDIKALADELQLQSNAGPKIAWLPPSPEQLDRLLGAMVKHLCSSSLLLADV